MVAGEAADQGPCARDLEAGQSGPPHREDSSPLQHAHVEQARIHRISVSGRVTVEALHSDAKVGRRLHAPSPPRKPADTSNKEGQKSVLRGAACSPNPRHHDKSKNNNEEERRRTTGILLRRTALDSFSIPLHPPPPLASKTSPEPNLLLSACASSSSSSSSTPLPAPPYSSPHGPWAPAPFNLAFRGAAGAPTTRCRFG